MEFVPPVLPKPRKPLLGGKNLKAKKGMLLKVTADEIELPTGVDEIEIENDGSTRVKIFGTALDTMKEKAKAMRGFFYQKPHFNDVANALIVLGATLPDEELAEAIENLKRRRPKKTE